MELPYPWEGEVREVLLADGWHRVVDFVTDDFDFECVELLKMPVNSGEFKLERSPWKLAGRKTSILATRVVR